MTERISHHACKRALERLGLGRHSFIDWCKATRRSWLPVNAEFLRVRNVMAATNGCTIYVTPWTADTGVALLVSDDNNLMTVLTFHQTARMVSDAAAYPPAPAGRQELCR